MRVAPTWSSVETTPSRAHPAIPPPSEPGRPSSPARSAALTPAGRRGAAPRDRLLTAAVVLAIALACGVAFLIGYVTADRSELAGPGSPAKVAEHHGPSPTAAPPAPPSPAATAPSSATPSPAVPVSKGASVAPPATPARPPRGDARRAEARKEGAASADEDWPENEAPLAQPAPEERSEPTSPPPPPDLRGAIDEAMGAPMGDAAGATPRAAPAASKFDLSAAEAALRSAAASAATCRHDVGSSASARVAVTFAPSGSVTRALITAGPLRGTEAGGCVARAFRGVSIAPFEGEAVTVTKSVTIP